VVGGDRDLCDPTEGVDTGVTDMSAETRKRGEKEMEYRLKISRLINTSLAVFLR
jgi:hypothetical protein